MVMKLSSLIIVLALAAIAAQGTSTSLSLRKNPIRKVVTMMQKIQEKVKAEAETEDELHEKFLCYCKTEGNSLTGAIADGKTKVENLAAQLETAKGQKTQLESDLKQHKADRIAAKEALAEATAMREKEAGAFAATKAEAEANIAAVNKAVAAIEKGAGGAFLQTDAAERLRDLAQSNDGKFGQYNDDVVAFLSNDDSSGTGGEITGILKTLGEQMGADLAKATADENESIKVFDELTAAKNGEVTALSAAIEDKINRVGESGVNIANMKADADDTADAVTEDKAFLVDLQKNCKRKTAEYEKASKARSEEQVALADTIKMLNSDEALELFKKTLPSAAASFMQVEVTTSMVKARVLDMIHAARKGKSTRHLDLIALLLHGKTTGFGKVIGMIDEMTGVLKEEQKDDDKKKEYCGVELDKADDKKKATLQSISDADAAIADAKETAAKLKEEIEALVLGVQVLDAQVAQATEQRKKESAAWKDLQASNGAAKELILMAKKRLQKFYNPTLASAASFVQIKAHEQLEDLEDPAPQASGLFQTKKEEATGVIALMDTLVADLEKETTVAETEEKDAQEDYETFMADSKKMRADNGKMLEDKESAKADANAAFQKNSDDKEVLQKKLRGTFSQIQALHKDCDWLLSNYDSRKEARNDEIDAMAKAKAVLSGA